MMRAVAGLAAAQGAALAAGTAAKSAEAREVRTETMLAAMAVGEILAGVRAKARMAVGAKMEHRVAAASQAALVTAAMVMFAAEMAKETVAAARAWAAMKMAIATAMAAELLSMMQAVRRNVRRARAQLVVMMETAEWRRSARSSSTQCWAVPRPCTHSAHQTRLHQPLPPGAEECQTATPSGHVHGAGPLQKTARTVRRVAAQRGEAAVSPRQRSSRRATCWRCCHRWQRGASQGDYQAPRLGCTPRSRPLARRARHRAPPPTVRPWLTVHHGRL